MDIIDTDRIKGCIGYPCCPKEKIVVFIGSHGGTCDKCPNCGKFARFDLDNLISVPTPPIRGLMRIRRKK